MAERPFFIRVSPRGLTGSLSLNELIIFALFVAVCGLALAGPLLTFAEQNPGHHLLSLATYALLCAAVPSAFFLATLLSFLHAAEAPVSTMPIVPRLAAATFNAAAAAALLLAAVLFLLLFASAAPATCGGFPWFGEEF